MNTARKVLLIIGLVFQIICFALVVSVYCVGERQDAIRPFALWIYSIVAALPFIICYLAEAILALVERRNAFTIVRAVIVFLLPVVWVVCGGSAGNVEFTIWLVYCELLFVLQFITLFARKKAAALPEYADTVTEEV